MFALGAEENRRQSKRHRTTPTTPHRPLPPTVCPPIAIGGYTAELLLHNKTHRCLFSQRPRRRWFAPPRLLDRESCWLTIERAARTRRFDVAHARARDEYFNRPRPRPR